MSNSPVNGHAPPRARTTLNEVARHAGVSSATASKALNNRADVSDTTRRRVLDAMARTGYRRSTEQTPSGRPTVIAAAESFASSYSSIILDGMVASAASLGADLIVSHLPTSDDAAQQAAWAQRVADAVGIAFFPTILPPSLLDAAVRARQPLVAIDPVGSNDGRAITISATNWQGGRTATDHLIELGHSRIAWIGGVPGSVPSHERQLGFTSAMQSAGLAIDEALVASGGFSFAGGRQTALHLLGTPRRPTAIVCGNDHVALGALQAGRDLGLLVPADLSVTGFDDVPQSAQTSPALTTIRQPLRGMGAMAVETLLSLARGSTPPSTQVQLATTLIVRETTAPPQPTRVNA